MEVSATVQHYPFHLENMNAHNIITSHLDVIALGDVGPDHAQVFWKHKSIGNQASDWLIR